MIKKKECVRAKSAGEEPPTPEPRNQEKFGIGKLLVLAKTLSRNEKLHIEIKIGNDKYIYEDGERILSNIDNP